MFYSLILIDMQPIFEAANKVETINNCIREIEFAINAGANIIVVEYYTESVSDFEIKKYGSNCMHTNSRIMDALVGYKNVYNVVKQHDDGGIEVDECIRFNNLSTTLKVCGVNISACVYKTVYTLSRMQNWLFHKKYNIEIIADACNCCFGMRRYDYLVRLNYDYGVKVKSVDPAYNLAASDRENYINGKY